jgi:hypothetical protein
VQKREVIASKKIDMATVECTGRDKNKEHWWEEGENV